MAAIEAVFDKLETEPGCRLILWETLTESDTATEVELGAFADRSVQVVGTFGGATVVVEGSNDGTNWVTLSDYQGTALSFTAAFLAPVAELTRFIRVSASGGTGQDLDIHLMCRGTHHKTA